MRGLCQHTHAAHQNIHKENNYFSLIQKPTYPNAGSHRLTPLTQWPVYNPASKPCLPTPAAGKEHLAPLFWSMTLFFWEIRLSIHSPLQCAISAATHSPATEMNTKLGGDNRLKVTMTLALFLPSFLLVLSKLSIADDPTWQHRHLL